jgi:outer membrane protein assembly factor BamB
MANMPAVKAADVATHSYIAASPNPVGRNQQVLVSAWVLPLQPYATDVFHNMTVTITIPGGGTETRGPLTSSTVGATFFSYIPTVLGDYTFSLHYPGETFASTGDAYLASDSPVFTLTVQAEPVQGYPGAQIPTDYWTRPIYAQNREWASIAGDWLQRGYNETGKSFDAAFGYNPYSQAPRSAHIMWTKPLAIGGTVGGTMGPTSYYSGLSYQPYLTPPVIMGGRLYYNIHTSFFGGASAPGFACVDLRTGEELWRNTAGMITCGWEYNVVSGNQMGVVGPYLWNLGSTYTMYDANTGEEMTKFANAQTGTVVMDPTHNGEMHVYVLNGAAGWLAMWNSTKAFEANFMLMDFVPPFSTGQNTWAPNSGTYEWSTGIEWNRTDLSIVSHYDPNYAFAGGIVYPSLTGATGNVLIAYVGFAAIVYYEIGYSMIDGEELWVAQRDTHTSGVWISMGEGKYLRFFLDTRTHRCYDAATGEQLWISEPMDAPWGTFSSQYGTVANGKFYYGGYDGHEYCFNMTNGKILWKFSSGNAGAETPYGSYPFWNGPIIADNVILVGTGEHSPTQPLIRGERLFAIDGTTGKGIWNITGLMVVQAIADGYLVAYNAYDNQIYVFGKGPSATTVSAPSAVIAEGSSVLIQGSVTDQSSGQRGTPLVSKDSMGGWMAFLHMQQTCPSDVKGVPVMLYAIRSNGTQISIGTATSDQYGNYATTWTPPSSDTYKILALFPGDESYGTSWAETALGVGPAPEEPEPEPVVIPDYTAVFAGLAAAVVVVAILVIYDIMSVRKLRK